MESFKHKKHQDSFISAVRGLILGFQTQPNFKIMLVSVFSVVSAGVFFQISQTEWLFVVVAVALVMISEMINTSIEAMCDLITTEWRESAKTAKDVAGGMVLLAVIFAIIIGVAIFLPKFLWFNY